jgi:hypothetical protein
MLERSPLHWFLYLFYFNKEKQIQKKQARALPVGAPGSQNFSVIIIIMYVFIYLFIYLFIIYWSYFIFLFVHQTLYTQARLKSCL